MGTGRVDGVGPLSSGMLEALSLRDGMWDTRIRLSSVPWAPSNSGRGEPGQWMAGVTQDSECLPRVSA